jgi:hypothetical protein
MDMTRKKGRNEEKKEERKERSKCSSENVHVKCRDPAVLMRHF